MNQVQKDLIAAKELIKDFKNWTFRTRARNSQGESVHVFDPAAVCFCAVGAVEKVLGDKVADVEEGIYSSRNPTIKCLNDACKEYKYGSNVWGFNDAMYSFYRDGEGHKQVLDVFDKAIEIAGTRDYSDS